MPGGAFGERVLFEQHDISPAEAGKVVRDAAARHTPADHNRLCGIGNFDHVVTPCPRDRNGLNVGQKESRMPDALDLVVTWAGQPVRQFPIKGGLSHRISRVEAEDGTRWLLRELDPRLWETGLGIPLDQEVANTVIAASSGIGPQVIKYFPEANALLLEYLDGITLNASMIPEHLDGIAEICRRLHAGPRFVNDFSIFAKLREFRALCAEHDLPTPHGYDDVLPLIADIERAIPAVETVPCHNDLLAENFIAINPDIRIIDYQLSGNNDPAFELGDIAAEADLDPDQTAQLTRAYFNDPTATTSGPERPSPRGEMAGQQARTAVAVHDNR